MGQEGGRKISDMTDEDYGLRRGNERRGAVQGAARVGTWEELGSAWL